MATRKAPFVAETVESSSRTRKCRRVVIPHRKKGVSPVKGPWEGVGETRRTLRRAAAKANELQPSSALFW